MLTLPYSLHTAMGSSKPSAPSSRGSNHGSSGSSSGNHASSNSTSGSVRHPRRRVRGMSLWSWVRCSNSPDSQTRGTDNSNSPSSDHQLFVLSVASQATMLGVVGHSHSCTTWHQSSMVRLSRRVRGMGSQLIRTLPPLSSHRPRL